MDALGSIRKPMAQFDPNGDSTGKLNANVIRGRSPGLIRAGLAIPRHYISKTARNRAGSDFALYIELQY